MFWERSYAFGRTVEGMLFFFLLFKIIFIYFHFMGGAGPYPNVEPYPKRSSFSSINVPFTYGSRITTWKSIFLLYQVNSRSISKARTADLSARH